MRYWKFKVFVNDNGKKDFEDWIEDLHEKDQNKIDWIIEHLEVTKVLGMPYFKKLKGYDSLCELRMSGQNNVPHRLLGCFGPKGNEFTILLGAIKKNGNYTPRDALKIADKRSKLIHEKGRTDDY